MITREVAAAESLPGGFSAVYDVLKALEDSGRIRRGYFVGGVAATQFALPPRSTCCARCANSPDEPEVLLVAATDPRESVRHAAQMAGHDQRRKRHQRRQRHQRGERRRRRR